MKLKIKSKLLLGFLVIISLTILLGLGSYISLQKITGDLLPALKANEHITLDMLQLRRNEKDFLARSVLDGVFFETGKSKYLTKFNKNFSQIEADISKVKESLTDAKHIESINQIEKLAKEYQKEFHQVVSAKRQKGFKDWGLIGKLRDSVHAIENSLASLQVKHDDVLVELLMIRRHEKDYFLRNDTKYYQKNIKQVANFKKVLKSSLVSKKIQPKVINLINDYSKKLNAVVKIDEVIGRTSDTGLMGKYRETIHRLTPLVNEQNKLFNKKVTSVVDKTNLLIIIGTLLAIILGLTFAVILANKITGPLRVITRVGNRAADGDLNATIPSIKTGDEVEEISETMKTLIGALKYHVSRR